MSGNQSETLAVSHAKDRLTGEIYMTHMKWTQCTV